MAKRGPADDDLVRRERRAMRFRRRIHKSLDFGMWLLGYPLHLLGVTAHKIRMTVLGWVARWQVSPLLGHKAPVVARVTHKSLDFGMWLLGYPLHLLGVAAHKMRMTLLGWVARRQVDPDDKLSGQKAPVVARVIRRFLGFGMCVLGFLLHLLAVVAYTFWRFLRKWIMSRPIPSLLWGFPAVAVFLAVGLLSLAGSRVSRSDLVLRYRMAAAEAAGHEDMKAAALWLERTTLLNPNDPVHQFSLAIASEQEGRHEQARQIMQKLAPEDKIGYGPAHFWIADHIARSRQRDRDPAASNRENAPRTDNDQATDDRFRHHLTAGLKHDPDNIAAREQLGQLELNQGNLPEAIEQLERLVRNDRRSSFVLAQLYVVQGDQERSSDVANAGADYFHRQVKNDPDDVESRIHWARLHAFMEQFGRTVEILSEGMIRRPEPEDMNRLRVELSLAFLGWAKHIKQTQPDKVALRLNLLQQALKFAPDNPHVLEQLVVLAGDDSDEARAAHDALSTALAEGAATPMVHLMLGIAAYKRKEYGQEKHHLRLALAADPQLVVAANNLAWRLANSDPPQLDEALELIEQALRQSPDSPEVRATRGRLYQLLDRTDDAILDLQFALSRLKDRRDIHTALADLYATAGNEDLERLHRERAANPDAEDD